MDKSTTMRRGRLGEDLSIGSFLSGMLKLEGRWRFMLAEILATWRGDDWSRQAGFATC